MTTLAAATADSADSAGSTSATSASASAYAARLVARGLKTRTRRSERTTASARRWWRASNPEPITATSSGPRAASPPTASAEVAAVR
nr:hypothetical protein [Nocardioides flavescens]